MRRMFAERNAMRMVHAFIIGLAALGPLDSPHADSIKVLDNRLPDLCEAAKAQATQLVRRDKSTCGFPAGDRKDGIRPIAWTPATNDKAKRAWSDFLAKAHWDKQIGNDDVASPNYDQFWIRNGPRILETLKSGAALEEARIDVDNDGVPEIVYRATTIRPIDPNDTQKGWAPYSCHGSQPYHSIFFDRSGWLKMGPLLYGPTLATSELLRYRDRTYSVLSGPDVFSVSEILRAGPEPSQVFTSQRCAFLVQ